jgi:PAS domain S-box-containing protein
MANHGEDSLRLKLEDSERSVRSLDEHIRVLEADRKKYQALVHHTDAGFLVADPSGRIQWASPTFREQFEKVRPGTDPVGLECHQVLCRKSSSCSDCPTARTLETGQVAHHEMNVLMDGGFRHVYTSTVPVVSSDGKLEQVLLMLQDLSSLKILRNSEEALRTTEQRYRSIFEQANAGMVTIRSDGSFLQVNPTLCTLLGYSEARLLRMKLVDVVHFDDQDKVDRWLCEAQAGTIRHGEVEYRFVRRDMTCLWGHCTAVWQFDEQGKPTHSVMLIQDISERKKAETALEQSRRRYQALVHSIDGIVWEADPRAFRFSFVSRQAERILGYSVEHWIAQPRFWRNHIHPEEMEGVVAARNKVVADKRAHEVEYRMISADGTHVWVRDTVSPVLENGKVSKLRGLMVDVTERKLAEEALRQKEEQLRQAQKMEAIGRLAGGIAHDFNNLLTAITGYGSLLLSKLGDDNPLRREATEIAKAAQRAADLTGQLLAFSRQQVLQPKVIDLNDVIQDMETMLRSLVGEQIELNTNCGLELGAVKADPGQIHQVLVNLVVNARDAMDEGGTIVVETSDLDFPADEPSRPPGIEPGSYVALSVSDTGCGMDQTTMSKLFEPFFTTKEPGKGTGLGLSTVYGIVKQSGGHIAVHSVPGNGSSFRILLPRVARAEIESAPKIEPDAEIRSGTERVLLVEDDGSVRELAREILEMNGYSVTEATNGVEALKVFAAEQGAIDLMVTDLVMPQMGGRELATKVTPLYPDLRVLFLSGYTDSVAIQQGMLDSGSYFLQKPFTPADLARTVREALDG